jgi:hypothetical protein
VTAVMTPVVPAVTATTMATPFRVGVTCQGNQAQKAAREPHKTRFSVDFLHGEMIL